MIAYLSYLSVWKSTYTTRFSVIYSNAMMPMREREREENACLAQNKEKWWNSLKSFPQFKGLNNLYFSYNKEEFSLRSTNKPSEYKIKNSEELATALSDPSWKIIFDWSLENKCVVKEKKATCLKKNKEKWPSKIITIGRNLQTKRETFRSQTFSSQCCFAGGLENRIVTSYFIWFPVSVMWCTAIEQLI